MDLQRDRSITLTQSYLINEETKVAVIPIMRNASSMLEYVLQQHNFTITKERRQDNSWTYYTVWRNPYERLISVLQRELCGVYDNNLHRVHAAIDEQMIQWSNNPKHIEELDHAISQYDTCVDIMPNQSELNVYPFEAIELMMFDATGIQFDNTPPMNVSADYPPPIIALWQGDTAYTREPMWLSGWCRNKYSRDYQIYERLLNSDTASIIETY